MSPYGILNDNNVMIAYFSTPLSMDSNVPYFASDSLSLKRSSVSRPAQRWELSANLEPMNTGGHKLSSLLARKGNTGTFNIVVPQPYGSIAARTCTSAVTASGAVDTDTISVSGANGLIPDGTFVSFSNHSKVYMLCDDTSGGSVRIFPRLRLAVSGTMYYRDDVKMLVSRDDDQGRGMSFTDGILMDVGSVSLIERI